PRETDRPGVWFLSRPAGRERGPRPSRSRRGRLRPGTGPRGRTGRSGDRAAAGDGAARRTEAFHRHRRRGEQRRSAPRLVGPVSCRRLAAQRRVPRRLPVSDDRSGQTFPLPRRLALRDPPPPASSLREAHEGACPCPPRKVTGLSRMKLIVAIIRAEKLEAVQAALNERDVYLMTVSDVRGCGRQRGYTELYRGTEYQVRLLPKLKLEIAVNEAFVEATVEAIVHAARTAETGQIGDGKIFILPLEDCIRIRTGERGGEAIGP